MEQGKVVNTCLHCNKIIRGGGINQLKFHLAGEKGQVESCKKVSAEIRAQMKQNIDENKKKKRKIPYQDPESGEYVDDLRIIDDQVQEITNSSRKPPLFSEKGKNTNSLGSYFIPRTTPGAQPTIKSVLQSKEVIQKAHLAISKWMVHARLPFNAANSPYFQEMFDAVCSLGAGFKAPTYHMLRGDLLNNQVDDVKKLLQSYRAVWKHTGCTIMADGWTDRCRRTLINFLVYFPKGTFFVKSVDASHASKTAELLYQLFKEIVLFVGPENVVQIVTDNAANYVAAGRLLEAEFPKIFWSPCAAHCVNLMFQDIGKLDEVIETVEHAAKITKYVYNHCYPLYLMRKFTCGKEILRPAPTRFATNFIALQSILAQKDALREMVRSRDWTSSAYSKDVKAKRFVEQVLDSRFWKQCADIVKLTEPLVRVLRIVDSEDKPAMGFLYQTIIKAREEMEKRFQRNKKKVEPYLKILDSRWDSQLRKNLHAAGYWLNPGCHFNVDEFEKYEFTTSGLLDVIERYSYGDSELQSKLTNEMRIFKDAQSDFGRQSALRERNTVMPDKWWECYGFGAPNLRKLAIRILSQTCSASDSAILYIGYTTLLQFLNDGLDQTKRQNYDPIDLAMFEEHSDWILEMSPTLLSDEEEEVLRQNIDLNVVPPVGNDIDQLNLDEDEDNDVDAHSVEITDQNASNVGQDLNEFGGEGELIDTTLAPWA
ncbi:uncharacterized protein LOC133301047 [Gastrolobium bilobum]|uniref:uncharacterized protein LOC133301047 n=1 Tax=Gastrolobium bilobum TaxID=150636 RepID=UPI002AB0F8E4|nr:uncharacterized protein LOC133301047 [Gastrolobium bilobum]